MRIRWRDFELPTRVISDKEVLTDSYGKFIAEPFERGFGVTIGNSLRRILLSSMEGAAVVSVKIEGVNHEFSTVPGIVEDMTDVILNIKSLNIKLNSEQPKKIKIEAKKKGVVTGADIITDGDVDIINKELHIATVSDNINFNVEMEVKNGRGYVQAEENAVEDSEVGVIPIDSIFSPIRNVAYKIEDTRVGHKTNYDRLVLEIWTNGSINPELALTEAAKVLRKHLNPFVQYFELGRELQHIEAKAVECQVGTQEIDEPIENLNEKMEMNVSELDLSVRASNCLDMANIKTVKDLAALNEEEALEIRNFGKTTLLEIKKKLSQIGLNFGMFSKSDEKKDEVMYNAP